MTGFPVKQSDASCANNRMGYIRPARLANILKSQLKCKHANEAAPKQFSLVQDNGGREVLAPYVI